MFFVQPAKYFQRRPAGYVLHQANCGRKSVLPMLKLVSGLVVGPVGCVQLAQAHIEDVGYFPAGEHSSAPDNDLCRTVEQVICDVGVDGAVKIGICC